MGFLRKVGRKIKKGVKKLFSTKLGALIGGIAISMMLGPLLGRAWNGLKGAFTGTGATAGTSTTLTTATSEVAAAEAAKQEVLNQSGIAKNLFDLPKLSTEQLLSGGNPYANLAAQGTPGISMETVKASFAQGTAASQTALKTAIQNGSPLDFTNALTAGTSTGTIPLNISDSVTGSLTNIDKFIETGNILKDSVTPLEQFDKVMSSSELAAADTRLLEARETLSKAVPDDTRLFGDKKFGQDVKQNFADFGTKVKDTIKDPSSLIGEDFVPNTFRTVAGAMAIDAVMGEEVDEGGYGRTPGSFGMESPQDSYVAQVRNQIPNTPVTNMQQMNQGLFFGTLSPQFLLQQQQYYS